MNYLILAGIYNSGSDHWQSHWLNSDHRFSKLEHSSWDFPDRKVWVNELEEKILSLGSNTVLVAHSLACLMVVHWASQNKLRVQGALLVSVPDPDGENFPKDAKNFGDLPDSPLPFPSIVVSSDNDPYGTSAFMSSCATNWGSQFVGLNGLGHINADSKLGDWSLGKELLRKIANPE